MSYHRTRHFALAVILGLVPLLLATSVNGAAPAKRVAPAQAEPFSAARIKQIRDTGPPVMKEASDYVATAAPTSFVKSSAPNTALKTSFSNPRLYREVFGFAYAQSIGDPTIGYPSWNMGLLSTVAYFGVHVDWTGALVGDSGLTIWDNPNGPVPGLIATAHASGVKVVLTIIMGDNTPDQRNICSALDRWQTTVQQVVNEVTSKGVDGVNIDYEGSNVTCMDPCCPHVSSQSLFTSFVAHMRSALPAGSYLSVDTYSGSAGYRSGSTYLGFFDIGALSNYVDSFFVMAYDMEYDNGGQPPLNCSSFCLGPTAPLSTYYWNDSRASAEYRAVVSASQVIMGIPYYGRKACVNGTPSSAPPNAYAISGTLVAEGYLDASTENGYAPNSDYHLHRDANDTLGNTEWDTWTSTQASCTREMYYDDVTSLGNKYNLVINDHLRGIGIFTLSYGGGAPELWSLINLKFGQCSEAALSADYLSPQIPGPTIRFTASALCAGTATFRFWMQAPGGSMTLVKDYSTSAVWPWNTSNLPMGTYTFRVDARNQGSAVSYDTLSQISFRLGVCAAPALATSPASPQLPGTPVTFTSTATCQGSPEYQFWLLAPGSHTWQIVQPYSSNGTFNWTTTGLISGTYLYTVWIRNAGTAGTQCSNFGCSDAYFPATQYVLTNQPCTSVSDTPNLTSPQGSGTAISFTASASGCPNPLYQFWLLAPGAPAWQVVQPYSSAATFNWNTTGAPAGGYLYTVWARDASSPGTACGNLGCNDSYSPATTYTLTTQRCSSVTDTPAPGSPQPSGTSITFTASASGCPHPLYQFWLLPPGSSTWQIAQAYSTTATLTWSTIGVPAGSYLYTVWARDSGGPGATCGGLGCEDTYSPATGYSLTTQPCTSVSDSPSPASPQPPGTSITFTASASGCPHPLYQFWVLAPGSHAWQIAQAYSTTPTLTWNTTGMAAGNYLYTVWVRDSGSTGRTCGGLGCSDAYYPASSYVLTSQACTSVTDSPAPGSPQAHGTTILFTAVASGCPHPLYQFWILAPGSHTWQIAQPYSTTATFSWNTNSQPAGTYTYTVWVRDGGGSGASCNSLGCYDSYYPATSYTLT